LRNDRRIFYASCKKDYKWWYTQCSFSRI